MKKSSISVEINGINYTDILEATVSRCMDAISGQFSFKLSINDLDIIPAFVGQPIKIIVGQQVALNGYIETISASSSSTEGNKFVFSGRDATCDLVDSTFMKKNSFSAPISLESIIKKCLSLLSLDKRIGVIKTDPTIKTDFAGGESLIAEKGDCYIEFLQKYASKKNVLLATDGNANILITTANSKSPSQTIIKDSTNFNNENNILSSSFSYDLTQRFNIYQSQSQQLFSETYDTDQAVNVSGSSNDNEIRVSRQISVDSQFTNDSQSAKLNAIYERNVRIGDSFEYKITCVGFYPINQNKIWELNTLISVYDYDYGIFENLLLKDIQFNYSLSEGAKTILTLVYPLAYTTFEPKNEKSKSNKQKGKTNSNSVINSLIPEAKKNLQNRQ